MKKAELLAKFEQEAELLSTRSLEFIRRIHDLSGVGVVLAGMPRLLVNLKGKNNELAQLYSRVGFACDLGNALPDDDLALLAESALGTDEFNAPLIKACKGNARRLSKLMRGVVRSSEINGVPISAELVEALLSIIGDVLKNDKEYQSLLKEYQAMPEGDRKAMMQKVSKYIEGTKVAEIMPDLQAGASTYAMLNDDLTKGNVQGQYKIVDKGGYNEESFKWFSGQSGFAFQVAKNIHEMTQLENFQKINDMAAEVAKGYSSLAQDFPNLHSALVGATDAVIAFGTALAASSVMDLLTGGKGGKGSLLGNAVDLATSRKGFKLGAGAGTLAAAGLLFYGASEGQIPYAARSEAENEKRAEAIKQFRQTNSSSKESIFRYGMPSTSMPTTQYHGGYVIADRLRANEISQERVKQGTLSQEELKNRTERNQSIIQGVLKPQVDAVSNTLSQYQADFHAFGQSISASLEAGLASQSHTIANQITVELDGRIIAEQVSEQQFNFSKRMA